MFIKIANNLTLILYTNQILKLFQYGPLFRKCIFFVNYNITICVTDVNSQIKFVSQNGGHQLEDRLFRYLFNMSFEPVQVLEQGNDYVIQITGKGDGEYLEMYGQLASGIAFIMQTPLESIRESAALANRFLAYVGIIGALLGGIVIWLAAHRVTKPILKLGEISDRMVHLDFEAKYTSNRHSRLLFWDEIDIISDFEYEQKASPTDHFLYHFLHEFVHSAHEDNLLNTLGVKKALNYLGELHEEK